MKTIPFASFPRWLALFASFAICGLTHVGATGMTNVVAYSPDAQGVSGALPQSVTYDLSVTCPLDVVATDLPLTVYFKVTPTKWPVGDAATAATYVTLSAPFVTFSNAGEVQSIQVTALFPPTALTASVPAGAYNYDINTTGWPLYITDAVSQINASVSLPNPSGGVAPVVTITTPNNNSIFSYVSGSFPHTIPFSFTATTDSASPVITSVGADFGTPTSMAPQTVSPAGLNSSSASGSGSITVTGAGTYKLATWAVNSKGTGQDEHTINVVETAPPPVAQINAPTAPNNVYTYHLGAPLLQVPFTFSASTVSGATIANLSATVDGVSPSFTAIGLGTTNATATVYLPYGVDGAGVHNLSVSATDDTGQIAPTVTGNFTINYIAPSPAVAISVPANNASYQIASGQTTINVPYSFTATANDTYVIDTVTATLNGNIALSPLTSGLGLKTVTGSGTMTLGPGTYSLSATGSILTASASDKVTFSVNAAVTGIPPTVVLNSPVDGYSLSIIPGTTAKVSLLFTGQSRTAGATISGLTAKLDGVPLEITTTTLNTPTATGSATMNFNAAGAHSVVVTATDLYGTATTTGKFTIVAAVAHKVSGIVFFDVDGDGVRDPVDYGLANVALKLLNSSCATIATTTSDASGAYSFPGLYPGTYTVVATPFAGLVATTPVQIPISMASSDLTPSAIGFSLNLCALSCMKANGYTIGYWKNNLDKATAGKCSGAQISAATITAYTKKISAFALSPFDGVTNKIASSIMGSTSSKPVDLLSKQLLAAEYNYANAAYLNGNPTLTYAFVYWGEWVQLNTKTLPSSYVLWAKCWFDAYNNSHGCTVGGPGAFNGSCTTAVPHSCGERELERQATDD